MELQETFPFYTGEYTTGAKRAGKPLSALNVWNVAVISVSKLKNAQTPIVRCLSGGLQVESP
jgi:hypothetical protein